MKPARRITRLAFTIAARLVRALLPRVSDQSLARLLRAAERIAYVLTGDRGLKASIGEVALVFELGPPYSATPRKVVASMETDADLALSAIQCLNKPSPYGFD